MTAKEFIAAMLALFEVQPDRWTFGAFARDATNNAVETSAPDAYRFSVNGFFERSVAEGLVTAEVGREAFEMIVGVVRAKYHHPNVVAVNDQMGFDVVLQVLREAAK